MLIGEWPLLEWVYGPVDDVLLRAWLDIQCYLNSIFCGVLFTFVIFDHKNTYFDWHISELELDMIICILLGLLGNSIKRIELFPFYSIFFIHAYNPFPLCWCISRWWSWSCRPFYGWIYNRWHVGDVLEKYASLFTESLFQQTYYHNLMVTFSTVAGLSRAWG